VVQRCREVRYRYLSGWSKVEKEEDKGQHHWKNAINIFYPNNKCGGSAFISLQSQIPYSFLGQCRSRSESGSGLSHEFFFKTYSFTPHKFMYISYLNWGLSGSRRSLQPSRIRVNLYLNCFPFCTILANQHLRFHADPDRILSSKGWTIKAPSNALDVLGNMALWANPTKMLSHDN